MIDRVVKTCYNNLGVSGSEYTYSIYKIISICLLKTAQDSTIDSSRFYTGILWFLLRDVFFCHIARW